jgi:adenylate kinase family enzyme
MNLKEIAAELAALTVIKDAVTEATNTLRELAKDELTNVGADMTKAVIDNQEVAKITLISRDASFVVLDEKALVAWITDNFPTEIEPKVRDSFRKKFTETLAITAENQIFSTMTGEVLAFMGLDYKAPYVSTRFSSDGRETVLEAIRNHRVTTLPWLNFYVESQKLKEIE